MVEARKALCNIGVRTLEVNDWRLNKTVPRAMEITRLQSWKLAGKAIQGIKLGGLARRPVSKGIPEGEDSKESGMGRVHVVTVESSEVLFLPGGGGEAVDLKRRCEARDAQSSGSPNSLVFDETEALFVADFAKRAIISQRPAQQDGEEERFDEFDILVSDYEGKPFCGPNSLAFDRAGNLFFTDSGPLGETSLEKPRGSVFCVEVADQLLKPLAFQSMAHPSGVAVSPDGSVVYVSETMANRIVRFVKQKHGVFLSSVFYQFSGGFGPTALSLYFDQETKVSYLLVARFDFGSPGPEDGPADPSQAEGSIAVIKHNGELVRLVAGPPALGPEMTGLLVAPHAETDPVQAENATGLSEQSVYITSTSSHMIYSAPLVDILQLESD